MTTPTAAAVAAATTRLLTALEPLHMDSVRTDHSTASVHCTRGGEHVVLALRTTDVGTYWYRAECPGSGKHAGVRFAGVAGIGDEYAAASYVARELPYRPDAQPMIRGL